ncbi:MAG: DinB family protein [Pyrinomonadaceae bacterium]
MAGQSSESETLIARAFVQQARELLKDQYLPRLERCLEKLTDEQIWWRPNEDSNSIGNLLLHLSGNARQWIVSGLGGEIDNRVRQREFDERASIPRAELRTLLKGTLKEVDAVLASFDLTRLLEQRQIQGTSVTALAAIFHVTEHFSMHTGQIILLTKQLTASDLHFYDFEGDAPVQRWRSNRS